MLNERGTGLVLRVKPKFLVGEVITVPSLADGRIPEIEEIRALEVFNVPVAKESVPESEMATFHCLVDAFEHRMMDDVVFGNGRRVPKQRS